MELSERRKQILCMAVEEYIKDSAPITSGGIKYKGLSCSTATLRNELNTLEAMGYLRQLHTSGGRVPTAQGYRYYVEALLNGIEASDQQLEDVKNLITSRTTSLNEIISGIAKIVSRATNYPTFIMVDGIENLVLTEFRIIPLIDNKAMVLIGTNAGYINETLQLSASLQECQDASVYLTKNFKGTTISFMLENMSELEEGMKGEIEAFSKVVNSLISGLKKLNSQKLLNVERTGSVKLLENGKSVEEAKKVLQILDDKEKLEKSLELRGKGEIEVDIAEEEGKDCSVVKAPILVDGRQLASIGVIGPQRMDYLGIASALKVVIDELNSLKGDE